MKTFYLSYLLLTVTILESSLIAGEWHSVADELQGNDDIIAMTSRVTDFNEIFAVGNRGRFYKSQNSGRFWEWRDTPIGEKLNDIEKFFGGGPEILIAVGDNGTIIRSSDFGESWQASAPITTENLNSVLFDESNNFLWIAGENGTVFNSSDLGQSWNPVELENPGLNIFDLAADPDGLFIAGFKNDTSFVHIIKDTQAPFISFLAGDTLPGINLTSMYLKTSNLYLGGNDQTGQAIILARMKTGAFLELPQVKFSGPSQKVMDIGLFSGDKDIFWFATENGEIWQSNNLGDSWQAVYKDSQRRTLNALLINKSGDFSTGQAIAAGLDGHMLRYSFELLFMDPGGNAHLNYPVNQIEMAFSAVVDKQSIKDNIWIRSNYSGMVPFDVQYDNLDSTGVSLIINRTNKIESVPGEKWNISVGSGIKQERDDGLASTINGFNYDVTFIPYGNGELQFRLTQLQTYLNKPATNFVNGWFNDDDVFDVITYAGDSLFIFELDNNGEVLNVNSFDFTNLTVNPAIKNQLILADLNNDALPDLLAYDETRVSAIINQSSGGTFDFRSGDDIYNTNGIKQVLLYNADNNDLPDMLVLNDSLYTRFNISDSQIGTSNNYLETSANITSVNAVDVDMDGRVDLFSANTDGTMSYYHGLGNALFDVPFSFANSSSYREIFFGDFDKNGFIEILVLKNTNLDLYIVDRNNPRSLIKKSAASLNQNTPSFIEDIIINDFGGNPGNNLDPGQIDLVMLTTDNKLKFFENITFGNNDCLFSERIDREVDLGFTANSMIPWDSNRDAHFEVLAFDKNAGNFKNIINESWAPEIYRLETESAGLRISWQKFPIDLGSFEFYRLYRDTVGPDFNNAEFFDFTNINDTTFLDRNTERFKKYWFSAEAYYNGGEVSQQGRFREIQLRRELSGQLSGILADTINGLVIDDSIIVTNGQNLIVQPGVTLEFSQDSRFDVFGGLSVTGNEKGRIEFHGSFNNSGSWEGINLHNGTDTVTFSWFSISDAKTALTATDRPLKMEFGGLKNNDVAIDFENQIMGITNVLFDSNMTSLRLKNASNAIIKNSNIMHNANTGVIVESGATLDIKNSILWFNQGPAITASDGATVNISYSTIDSAENITFIETINKRIPIFSGSVLSEYQPHPFSPTVDAGDPNDDYNFEPAPNGQRINQGVLGGSVFATQSIRPKLTVLQDTLFSAVVIGKSDTLVFNLTNSGVTDLDISSIALGSATDRFELLPIPSVLIGPGVTNSYEIVFTPLLRQTYNEVIVVKSNDPANPSFEIPIKATGLNNLPGMVSIPGINAASGFEYNFKLESFDADGDDVTITALKLPGWLNLTNADELIGTPQIVDTGLARVELLLTDSFGDVNPINFNINVLLGNQKPTFIAMPDSVIYTNVPFDYGWSVKDEESDPLTYYDNSPLFEIDPKSGVISFTPQLQDTGNYMMTVNATDGFHTVSDSFNLQINPNNLNAVQNLVLEAEDQAINVSFTFPENDLYSGTMIRYSMLNTDLAPDKGILAIDTILSVNDVGKTASIKIKDLEINQNYTVSVYNYFKNTDIIYSAPLKGHVTTLAPQILLVNTDKRITLAVNKNATEFIKIKNRAGGTLKTRLTYFPDSLANVWFTLDTLEKIIAPFDSIDIGFEIHPNKYLPRGDKDIDVSVLSNDPSDADWDFKISLNPVFDDFAPVIKIIDRSDSLVHESAFAVHFEVDDTSGNLIGDSQEKLYTNYRLFKGLLGSELLQQVDSIQDNHLNFFPLEDGVYVLQMWSYDSEKNGLDKSNAINIPFAVKATRHWITRNQWQMLAIPRPVEVVWKNYIVDSLIQMYRWDNMEEQYQPVHSFIDNNYNMGEAMWIISALGFPINVEEIDQASLDDSLVTPIVAGWNQLGTPLGYSTSWADMMFTPQNGSKLSLLQAVENNFIDPAVYWHYYNEKIQGYLWSGIDSAIAMPWVGYWLKSKIAGSLHYSTKAVDKLTNKKSNLLRMPKGGTEKRFNISLQNEHYHDNQNIFGISQSKNGLVSEPPHIGSYCSFYFVEDDKRLTQSLKEVINTNSNVQSWQAIVESREAQLKHELKWNKNNMNASGLYVYLVDEKKEKIINMNIEEQYSFKPGSDSYSFVIYATEDASFEPQIIPQTLRLVQNYPNPFNPQTTIRFGVPAAIADKNIALKIYNVLGQEILQLFNKKFLPGYHEVNWNGQNAAGQKVASGVYFYTLLAGKATCVKKMILVR